MSKRLKELKKKLMELANSSLSSGNRVKNPPTKVKVLLNLASIIILPEFRRFRSSSSSYLLPFFFLCLCVCMCICVRIHHNTCVSFIHLSNLLRHKVPLGELGNLDLSRKDI